MPSMSIEVRSPGGEYACATPGLADAERMLRSSLRGSLTSVHGVESCESSPSSLRRVTWDDAITITKCLSTMSVGSSSDDEGVNVLSSIDSSRSGASSSMASTASTSETPPRAVRGTPKHPAPASLREVARVQVCQYRIADLKAHRIEYCVVVSDATLRAPDDAWCGSGVAPHNVWHRYSSFRSLRAHYAPRLPAKALAEFPGKTLSRTVTDVKKLVARQERLCEFMASLVAAVRTHLPAAEWRVLHAFLEM